MNIQKLSLLASAAQKRAILPLFNDSERASQFSLSAAHLFLDYSKGNPPIFNGGQL